MKITYSQIDPDLRRFVEQESEHSIQKLKTLLKRYAPDLVVLHTSLEKVPRKNEFSCSVNLTLPTATLHATGVRSEVRTSLKVAFAEIEMQVKKHKQKLRKDYLWKRKRPHPHSSPRLEEAFSD
jgi:ribosomal subunit interface protein